MKELSIKTQNRLEQIKCKTFLLNANQVKILDYKINGEKVQIVTDHGWHEPSYEKVDAFLDKLLPVEDDAVSEKGQLIVQHANQTSSSISELNNILMENIRLVQQDDNNIPKANAINNSAKQMINLAKVQLEVLKAMKS